MRLLKWLGLGLALALLVGGGALLVLKKRYPPERLRALAVSKIEPVIGRKLKLASVSLGLRGFEIGGLEVSEAPDFSAGTFFKAKRVTAGWSLRALLERRVMISELKVSDFECWLKRDAAGKLNLPASEPAAPAPKKKKGKPGPAAVAAGGLAVTVSKVELDEGTIQYTDASGLKAKLKHLEGRVSGIGTGPELPVTLALDYSVERPGSKWTGKAEVVGTVKTGKDLEALLAPLRLTFGQLQVKWDGRLRLVDGGLEATLAPLELEHSGLHLLLDGKLTRSSMGAVKLSAKGKLPALSADDLKRLGASASGSLALPMGTAELEVAYADDRVTLSPAIVTLGPAKIDARGSVKLGDKSPALDLKLKTTGVPIITLAPLVPFLRTYLVLGKADLDLKVSGRADAPVLAGEGKISDRDTTINGFALRERALALSFDPKRVKAALQGKLAGAALSVDVDAKDYATAPDVHVEGKLASLDLGPWAARPAQPADESADEKPAKGAESKPKSAAKPLTTSGKFTLGPVKHPNFQTESESQLEWDLRGITPDLAQLHGKTTLRVGKGRFDNLELLAAKSPVAKVAFLPLLALQKLGKIVKIPFFPSLDKAIFSEITGDYLFVKGVMTVKESHLDSKEMYLTTTGTADIARGPLDLRIAAKSGLLRGAVSGPIAFFVRGTLANPEYKPDVAAILKQPGVEQVIDQGKKLLQGIFK